MVIEGVLILHRKDEYVPDIKNFYGCKIVNTGKSVGANPRVRPYLTKISVVRLVPEPDIIV